MEVILLPSSLHYLAQTVSQHDCRNEETVEFVEWLKKFNMKRNGAEKVGIYGVDIYSLWETADAVCS